MNLSELNKEQKQMLVLAIGGVITFFSVMANMVIGPARADAAKAREVIDELEDKVSKGERILSRNLMINREVQQASADILATHQEHLPPRISPYIWAVENLSLLVEDLDLVISVQEHPTSRYMPIPEGMDDLDVNSIPFWIPYTVDVEMNTSFAKLKSFLRLLEQDLPFASVAGISVQASALDPEHHEIQVMVEWPTFRFDEDLEWMMENKAPERSE